MKNTKRQKKGKNNIINKKLKFKHIIYLLYNIYISHNNGY